MANRQRAEARKKAAAKAARQEGGSSRTTLWVIVAILVVVGIGGIVFAVTRDSGSSAKTPTTGTGVTDTTTASGAPVSMPVKVTGDVLPAFDDTKKVDPAVGMTAPTLEAYSFSREKVTIDSSKGAYMLVFLAHWCPHCNAEVPRLNQWKDSGGVPTDLQVIGVATAVSKTSPNYPPGPWLSGKGWTWPSIIDEDKGDGAAGTAATAFGATGWPYFVIVGADGKVKVRVSGEVQITDLQKIVDAALKA
jgi:cytochrome c biogenesis protein CcmG, thiol:disulfide interchange protein DsbE